MNEHECAVGILYEYEDTDMVTLKTLREEIEIGNKVFGTHETLHHLVVTQCGFKKFNYCPECGSYCSDVCDVCGLCEECCENCLIGDINGDSTVDIDDALDLFRHAMLPELYIIEYSGSIDVN
jgi:hypothetical protein